MKENPYHYSQKDVEQSLELTTIERVDEFQKYIDQLGQIKCKSCWIHLILGLEQNAD